MKILIADDDVMSCLILAKTLRGWGYEVVTSLDGSQAWTTLRGIDAPNLVILDWVMPGVNGLALCRRIRETGGTSYTYVILLTSKNRTEDIIEALEAGADDFISKPYEMAELRARLHSGQRILGLEKALLEAQQELARSATRDFLTGIYKQEEIELCLTRELDRAWREGSALSVILGDLDQLEQANEVHGYAAGDAVLVETASRMEAIIRSYDLLGKHEEDRFLVILPGCGLDVAGKVAERIRSCIGDRTFHTDTGPIAITMSLGVAARPPTRSSQHRDLLQLAEALLYRAKKQGKNCVVTAGGTL